MDMIKLVIDGREIEVEKGKTVLEAAEKAGSYIPTLCAHPDLEPYGGCRLCIVKIEKTKGFPISCTLPAAEGMVVTTDSPELKKLRQGVLELILSEHPSECLICDRRERCKPDDICLRSVAVTDRCVLCPANGKCELQDVVDYIGIDKIRLSRSGKDEPQDASNPFFTLDRNKCILCARCVRTCNEVTGARAIDMAFRGFDTQVGTYFSKPLIESTCRSCGECAVRCPTGALVARVMDTPDYEVKTVCPYCGVGCQMYLGIKNGKIIGVRGDPEGPANEGRLCVKGRFGIADFVHSKDRLTSPLIKRNGRFEEASWEEALNLVAGKLKHYRGDEVGVVTSASATSETNFVLQKLGRAVLGTNNIDHCARL